MMNSGRHIKRLLSVAIITINEEERLYDCLRSVAFADEVLVVDSGSSDKTVEIAKSFGAKVLIEKWRGFSAQKQFAVDHCINDWVLILDADERIPNETAEVITQELSDNEYGVEAYSFRRKNLIHGQWIRHCGWWPDRIVRLVNRKNGKFDGRPVHERWISRGEVKEIDSVIEHISFRNYSEMVSKMENYSNLASKELFKNRVNITPLTPIFHSLWMFIKTYFLELGFFDGFNGFMISIMNAGGSFLKYAKLRELNTYRKISRGYK
ncbi:MAG: glycosyltransferase family 2 protein [Thermodesulfobacteriota bacterium]|nr:glycosyltransferase family 2 protein [Thermodesulfobacteriota bacterium]